jgi:hypothetical protein
VVVLLHRVRQINLAATVVHLCSRRSHQQVAVVVVVRRKTAHLAAQVVAVAVRLVRTHQAQVSQVKATTAVTDALLRIFLLAVVAVKVRLAHKAVRQIQATVVQVETEQHQASAAHQ